MAVHARARLLTALVHFFESKQDEQLFAHFLPLLDRTLNGQRCSTCLVELPDTGFSCSHCQSFTFCSTNCADTAWASGHHAEFCQKHATAWSVLYGGKRKRASSETDDKDSDSDDETAVLVIPDQNVDAMAVDVDKFELYIPEVAEAVQAMSDAWPSTPPRIIAGSPPPTPRKTKRSAASQWVKKQRRAKAPSSILSPAENRRDEPFDLILEPLILTLHELCRLDPMLKISLFAFVLTCKNTLEYVVGSSTGGLIREQYQGFWTHRELALAALTSTSPTFVDFINAYFNLDELPRPLFLSDADIGLALGLAGASQEDSMTLLAHVRQFWAIPPLDEDSFIFESYYYEGLVQGRHMQQVDVCERTRFPTQLFKRWSALYVAVSRDLPEVLLDWPSMQPDALRKDKALQPTWETFMDVFGCAVSLRALDILESRVGFLGTLTLESREAFDTVTPEYRYIYCTYRGPSQRDRLAVLKRKLAIFARFKTFMYFYNLPLKRIAEIVLVLDVDELNQLTEWSNFSHLKVDELLLLHVLPENPSEERVVAILHGIIRRRPYVEISFTGNRIIDVVANFVERQWLGALEALRPYTENARLVYLNSAVIDAMSPETMAMVTNTLGLVIIEDTADFWTTFETLMSNLTLDDEVIGDYLRTRVSYTKVSMSGLTPEQLLRIIRSMLRRGPVLTEQRVGWNWLRNLYRRQFNWVLGVIEVDPPVDPDVVDLVEATFNVDVRLRLQDM